MATWFHYDYCRDVAAMREFLVEDIGLQLVWDEPDNVAVVHDDVQLDFTLDVTAPLPPPGWAFQPGWANGQLPDAPPTVPT